MSDDAQKALNDLMSAWEEFKAANDQNLKKRDTVLDDKLAKIEKEVFAKLEPLNLSLTQQQANAKAVQEHLDRLEAAINRASLGGAGNGDREAKELRAAFDRMLRRLPQDRDPKDVEMVRTRVAALVKSDDAGAGFLLAPPDIEAEIVKGVVETTPMRSFARVRPIGGPSYKTRRRTGTASASRIGERDKRTNTDEPSYGMVEILAPEMFARIEVSQQMLEDAGYDLLDELRMEAVEQFAVREGREYISGTGANNEAQGILVAAGVAETVSGDATKVTADGLIDLYHGLKTAYAREAVWGLNRSTLGAVRKLKGTDGHYLWQPGLVNGNPNTILGAPYGEMPDMPDVAAGAYPVVFGNFRRAYTIVDRIGLSIQVDYTTGADDGLVVFRARKRTGGGVVLAEAIRKLKIAAS